MPELLLEILSEEIPARMQARAAEDMKRLVCDQLKEDGLEFGHVHAYVTPRRLALVVEDLPVETEAVEEDRRGPPKAAPEKAVVGFAKSNGVSVDQLEIRDTRKGEYYFVVVKEDARQTIDYMPLIVSEVIFNMGWPKSMRWNSTAMTWVRPIQSILGIFDGKLLDDVFQLGLKNNIPGLKNAMNGKLDAAPGELEIPISNTTTGHRFHAPESFTVKNFDDYRTKLAHNKVMLDPNDRRRVIEEQAQRLADKEGLKLKADIGLMNEVSGLVEWPVVLMGTIDEDFMDLPPEVLSTAMRSHQKYFSMLDEDGNLAPRFIVVSNMETADGGKGIVAGNERVLRARLSDAKFFWDQDRKKKLVERLPDLDGRVFYKDLGAMSAKAERIAKLARQIAGFTGADPDKAEHAARLAKADLSSEVVGEFAELQGIMGGYYALNDGEDDETASAICEHYAPQGPGDACPTQPLAVTVALADKIDSLVGFFGINEKPTGSKDPFALRRAALGVIRLIIENDLEMPLFNVFKTSQEIYRDGVLKTAPEALAADLLAFFADRLKAHLKEEGVRHDLISAVFEVESLEEGGEDDLVRLLARVDALKDFLGTEDGGHLLVAYRRAANILRIEEKKDGKSYGGVADEKLFELDEERVLFDELADASAKSLEALKDERFADAMTALARLREPVDAFFDHVTVNCTDAGVRGNRLRLLSQIRSSLGGMADFSKIEGTEK